MVDAEEDVVLPPDLDANDIGSSPALRIASSNASAETLNFPSMAERDAPLTSSALISG